jgi:hypothetical protein
VPGESRERIGERSAAVRRPSGTFSTDRYREFLRALFQRTTSLASWE